MLSNGLKDFADKNILLLQGPIGPFFYRFAKKLKKERATVYKINFNGGDFLFYPFSSVSYTKSLENFGPFLKEFCIKNNIDSIKTHFNKLVELALFLNGCQWNDKIITDESYDYKISRLIKSIVEDVKALQIKINSNLVREIFIKKRIK